MAKDIDTIKAQFLTIQNEIVQQANTAVRVGSSSYDLAEYIDENKDSRNPIMDTDFFITT